MLLILLLFIFFHIFSHLYLTNIFCFNKILGVHMYFNRIYSGLFNDFQRIKRDNLSYNNRSFRILIEFEILYNHKF